MRPRSWRTVGPIGTVAGSPALASTTWTPLSLSNLVAYYNAGLGVTLSSGDVSALADQSGNGNNLSANNTGAGRLAWSATGFNTSFPGIALTSIFEGLVDNTFATTSSSFSMWTLFSDGGAASGEIFGMDTSNNAATLVLTALGSGGYSFREAGNAIFGAVTGSGSNGIQLVGIVGNGTTANIYNVGTSIANGAYTNSPGAHIAVGSAFGNYVTANPIEFAFGFITNAAMSAGDITNLKTFCNANWGTSF